MRGFVSILEVIITAVLVLIAFGVMLPRFTYTTKWDTALLLLKGRDSLVVLDRTGNLHSLIFNITNLTSFLNQLLPESNLVYGVVIHNVIKNDVKIACNCSREFINNFTTWFEGGTIINGRKIEIGIPCPTHLERINEECLERGIDVLVIEGDENKNYSGCKNTLLDLLKKGVGIVELMNFSSSLDSAQREVFGIELCNLPNCTPSQEDNLVQKPESIHQMIYEPYKFFYHLPLPVRTPSKFRFRNLSYNVSIENDKARFKGQGEDVKVGEGEYFKLGGYNFYLNYIRPPFVYLSFKPPYNFTDFLGYTRVIPSDLNNQRVLVHKGNYSGSQVLAPVMVVNSTGGNAVWTTNFFSPKLKDDLRLLLLSAILSSSKKTNFFLGSFETVYSTPYVNVENKDLYEVYGIELGIGYPY